MQTIDDGTLDEIGQRVSIAAINSPSAVTVAGDSDVLDDIARQLDELEIFNRFLTGKVPYHTHYMDAIKDDLCSAFEGSVFGRGDAFRCIPPSPANDWTDTLPVPPTGGKTPAPQSFSNPQSAACSMTDTPTSSSWARTLCSRHRLLRSPATQQTDVVVLATQRRNEDDSRTLMNCVGALHCHGHPIAWDALYPRAGARLLKLPSYPWQSKRFWNENPEAAEDLHYHPVHPLLGQPVSAVHPTWEAELSTAIVPFLADHQVQGSTVVPGAVFIEMALAAGKAAYGSTDHSVANLTLRRALILDETCDPMLRTTLNRDTGALEFAAFTATAGGDLKWTITATAELNALSRSPDRARYPKWRRARSPQLTATSSTPAPEPSGSPTVTHSRPSPASLPEMAGRQPK